MGLSYNPSSLNSNKTILQAIEELKKYLMSSPLSCIYETSSNVSPLDSSFLIADIINPNSQELKLGDIIVAPNGYYGFINTLGVSDGSVSAWEILSARIINASIIKLYGGTQTIDTSTYLNASSIYRLYPDANDSLKYRRSRGINLGFNFEDASGIHNSTTTLDIPYVSAIWQYEDASGNKYIAIDIYENGGWNVETIAIPSGANGQDGNDGVSITGATIDASNHLILTLSDGNTIDAGALPVASGFSNYVEINTTSGTFTDDEYAKLGFNDSVIVYDNGSYKTIYKKKIETSSIIEFESIDASARQNLKLIDVNKGTKAFSSTGISMITSATFDSGSATSGKVLTANGSGGTSWETAGGGTTLTSRSTTIVSTLTLSQKLSFLNTLLTTCKGNIVNSLISFSNIDGASVNVPLSDCNSASVGHLAVRSISHNIPNNAVYIINLIYNSNALQTASSSIIKINLSTFAMTSLTLGSIEPIASNTTFTYFNDSTISA